MGAVSGSLGGVAVATPFGLLCGPGAPLCMASAFLIGGTVGGAGGLVAGTVIGARGGLSATHAKRVNKILASLQQDEVLANELRMRLARAHAEVPLDPEQARLVVEARIDAVYLEQHANELLSLRTEAHLVQTWGDASSETRSCDYAYSTTRRDVTVWLANGGGAFREALLASADKLAVWMARDLDAFATRTPQPDTGELPATCHQI